MARQFIYHMHGLSKAYAGGKKVLDNIHLSFYPDAKIGVLGPNGSGKSTLLKIMAGVETEFTGEAWAADGARVGYLPQEPQLDEALNVLGNVMTRVRPNWIFGIRTPWTLSSERSWRETHRVGGYAFALTGLVVMGTALLAPTRVFVVLMVGALGTAALSVVWSWMVWRRDPATAAQREDG